MLVITILLVIITTLVGILIENLGAVFELTGSLSAISLGIFFFNIIIISIIKLLFFLLYVN